MPKKSRTCGPTAGIVILYRPGCGKDLVDQPVRRTGTCEMPPFTPGVGAPRSPWMIEPSGAANE